MKLRPLLLNICTGVEIYYSGRSEDEYLNAAFVLCDNYSELTSKLWLSMHVRGWSHNHDKEARKLDAARKNVAAQAEGTGTATPEEIALVKAGNRFDKFKNYGEVMNDVRAEISLKRPKDTSDLDKLQRRMKARHQQRNDLFHSAKMLSFNVSKTDCVAGFCDLLDYGRLLFGSEWDTELGGARNFSTMEVMLKLDAHIGSNPAVKSQVDRIFKNRPRNDKPDTKGSMVVHHPNDLYDRLCVIHGSSELRTQLEILLKSLLI